MLKISSLNKNYAGKQIFANFNLKIRNGDFVAFMGANGVGKTTLLNMIAGLIEPDSGSIVRDNTPEKELKIGYMMQNYAQCLYPWFPLWENIALPLRFKGMNKENRLNKVKSLMRKYEVSLPLESYPYELSGGQKQLSLLLQNIIDNPSLILFDEPFSSLDLPNSRKIQEKLVKIWRTEKSTILYVSHKIEDVIFLANRIIVLSPNPVNILLDIDNNIPYPRYNNDSNAFVIGELYNKLEKVIEQL